jgi:hypothetical protein
MSAEFQTIELYEEPDRNWRKAYHEKLVHIRDDFRRARERGDTNPRYFGWKRYVPVHLKDHEIDELARRMAERIIERAIIERRRTMVERKFRKGQAA